MIPSHQESAAAIAAAKEAFANYGRFFFGNAKLESELYDLGLLTAEDRYMATDIALDEITPNDRRGPNPPNDVSAAGPFKNERLYAFRWKSHHFNKIMYFKFAIACGSGRSRLVLYSLHEHRP